MMECDNEGCNVSLPVMELDAVEMLYWQNEIYKLEQQIESLLLKRTAYKRILRGDNRAST